jgi:hypothetical protein
MSYFTDQLKRPWTISNPSTTALVNKKLRKPGGAFKKFTDWGRDLSGKAELIAWGTNSTDDNSPSGTVNPEDLLFGSRRGIQGKRKSGKSEGEDMRRGLDNFDTNTLLTPGQKAKKLGPR